MGRFAVVLVLVARAAAASPALSLGVDGAGGEVWAKRAGWQRDDNYLGLRFGIGVGRFASIDVTLDEDIDRIEPASGVGVRVRPWAGPCWDARWSPYLRAQVALAAASHLGSNYDLLAGAGHWGRVMERAPWLHWFGEVDMVTRVGEYTSVSLRLDVGIAIATSSFWD
jgi:hypothetical protein